RGEPGPPSIVLSVARSKVYRPPPALIAPSVLVFNCCGVLVLRCSAILTSPSQGVRTHRPGRTLDVHLEICQYLAPWRPRRKARPHGTCGSSRSTPSTALATAARAWPSSSREIAVACSGSPTNRPQECDGGGRHRSAPARRDGADGPAARQDPLQL